MVTTNEVLAPLLEEVATQIVEQLKKQDTVLADHTRRLQKIETELCRIPLMVESLAKVADVANETRGQVTTLESRLAAVEKKIDQLIEATRLQRG